MNIPTESFFQTKHFLAPTLAEQQKIADFLSNVDSIITTETKILKNLQKKKKYKQMQNGLDFLSKPFLFIFTK